MRLLCDWNLALNVNHVLHGQGANPEVVRARRPALVEIAEWALAEGVPLLGPKVVVEEYNVESVRHESLILTGGKRLSGPLIVQHLAGASKVIAMLCTVGGTLEALVSEVIQTDIMHALALDGLGSAAVEELSIQACNTFGKQAEEEALKPSIPLSPGMVGWPVDDGQRQIFALVDGEQIGVRLNESSMMAPGKSLSLVLGIGKDLNYQGRTCDYCTLSATCRYQDHYIATKS